MVTPWPPDQTRVADYHRRLALELGRRVDVDVIVANPVDQYPDPPERAVRLFYARDFGWLSDLRQHDRVLYCLGNGELHDHAYKLLERRPGTVVLPVVPAAYITRELQCHVEQWLVHSSSARDELDIERGPFDPPVPISVIPFGMPPPVDGPRRDPGASPLIVSFGDAVELKGMSALIESFALLSEERPTARLVITGCAGRRRAGASRGHRSTFSAS